jgi:hypothetical protein
MSFVISSFITFPDIVWWSAIADATTVCFDEAAHFEKMTGHNRYRILGGNGPIQLSVPLEGGRNQRAAMKDIRISNRDRWQVQHWRTLTSAYKRAPYFDFYELGLAKIFESHFTYLKDFNLASIHWLKDQLKMSFDEKYTDVYVKTHPEAKTDLRSVNKDKKDFTNSGFPEYYQLFSDRMGFVPNLSMLDLLFAEGPYTIAWVRNNKDAIHRWIDR